MRLSRIWRILQISEGVIHRGFIIYSKYLLVLKGVSPFRSLFFRSPNITQPCPQVFPVKGSVINLQRAALLASFWLHRFNNFRRAALLTSLIQYGEGSFQIWWTAAGYSELCVWFCPIRNGKIFWMNNNYRYTYAILLFMLRILVTLRTTRLLQDNCTK